MVVNRIIGLKRKAQKEGWSRFIRNPNDEKALLAGHTFSFPHWDHFREYCETFLSLNKGRWQGQAFHFHDFQIDVFGSLFGYLRPDGTRRFRRGYIQWAKKNSKTTSFSAVGLYMLHGDGEPSPEVYNVANDRDQAALLWNTSADMVETSPKLLEQIKVLRSVKRMTVGTNAWFAAWSSDQSSKDGPNAHCIIVDELHAWSGESARELWRKIRYAGIARAQPLCPIVITTAGDDMNSLCREQYDYAKRIRAGDAEDLSYFVDIHEADPDKIRDDPEYWKSEEAWRAANPSFELILTKEQFESDVEEVENDPRNKAMFLQYRLNVWVQASTPWLPSHVWPNNKGPGFSEKDLEGQICFLGLDLSSVNDFTAATYIFPYWDSEGVKRFKWLSRIYCPEDTLQDRAKKFAVDIRVWIEQGFIRVTPGDCIDHERIYADIKADSEIFHVKEVGYDRHSAAWIVLQLQNNLPNIELFPVNQSMVGLSNATKALTMALHQGRVEHNANPVLSWMAGNAVPVTDAHENLMLHKGRSKEKIDAIVAGIIAFGLAEVGTLDYKTKVSVYSDARFYKAMRDLEGIDLEKKQQLTTPQDARTMKELPG